MGESIIMIKTLKNLGMAAAASAALCVGASEPDRLVVFGDSLSDTGQFYDPVAANAANPAGSTLLTLRFTTREEDANPFSLTKRVWVQHFAEGLGLAEPAPTLPYLEGVVPDLVAGDNYAVAGHVTAQTLTSITSANGNLNPDPDLVFGAGADFLNKDHIIGDGYLIKEPTADADALFVVWSGGNDLRGLRSDGGLTDAQRVAGAQAAAQNVLDGVQALLDAGATQVFVANAPDIGAVPESAFFGLEAEGTAASDAFNEHLSLGLAAMGSQAIIEADMESLLRTVQASPEKFGFSNEDHSTVAFDGNFGMPAWSGIQADEGVNGQHSGAPDSSKYVFFDGIHPTAALHEIMGDYALALVAVPVEFSPLGELAIGASRAQQRAVAGQVRGISLGAGQWQPFVAGSIGAYDTDADGSDPEVDQSYYGVSVGVSYGLSDSLLAGLSVGRIDGDADFGDSMDADVDGFQLQLHAQWQWDGGYVLWTGAYADQDVETDRVVTLGQGSFVNNGDTDGNYFGTGIELGLSSLTDGALRVLPRLSLNYQQGEIDGFVEAGDDLTRYSVADLEREALIAEIGIMLEYDLEQAKDATLFGGITLSHDLVNDSDDVEAAFVASPGRLITAAGYDADETLFGIQGGIRHAFTDNVDGTISADYQIGDRTDAYGVNAGLSISF
jgi:outer membrane lipase/esterase